MRRFRGLLWQAGLLTAFGVGLLLGLPVDALARGGGGSHGGSSGGGGVSGGGSGGSSGGFSGGSSGSSGTDGGGGGGGFGFGGFLFVIVIIAVIVLFTIVRASMRRSGQRTAPMAPPPARPAGPDPAVLSGLAAIKEADPAFEPESFLQRAEMVYFLVKDAFHDRNTSQGRAFLADPVYEGWKAEIEQLRAQGRTWVLENLNVRGMHTPVVQHGEQGDLIVVHFDVVSDNKLIDDATGRVVTGASEDVRYGERWTFERGPAAKTVVAGGVTASKCPNCGGLLHLDDDGKCDYCGVDVPGGQYDWTVTKMENALFEGVSTAESLGATRLGPAEGVAQIQQADPAFVPDEFYERAAQAFYGLQQAWQQRNLEPARPFMSPGLYLAWSAQVQQLQELHKVNVLEGLRIDGLEAVRVTHGNAFDDFTVRVRATCADYEVDERTNRVIFGSKSPSSFSEYWTFQRSTTAQTTDRHIMDKVCPNCGAPLQINQIGECEYCNAAVTSGRFDWVLSRIEQDGS